MKVRWTDESLRLRITPGELAALLSGASVETRLQFPAPNPSATVVQWRVVLGCDDTLRTARLSSGPENAVCLYLSRSDIADLGSDEREGVYFPAIEAGTRISFYVEKDFPCLHPRAAELLEPPTDTFQPPADFAARKNN